MCLVVHSVWMSTLHSMSGCPVVLNVSGCPWRVWMSTMCLVVHSVSGCPHSTACLDVHNVSGCQQHVWMSTLHSMSRCPQCVWLSTACLDVHNVSGCLQHVCHEGIAIFPVKKIHGLARAYTLFSNMHASSV